MPKLKGQGAQDREAGTRPSSQGMAEPRLELGMPGTCPCTPLVSLRQVSDGSGFSSGR